MRIFLDECIDWRLTRSFIDVEILTAKQMGWSELKNGKLLRKVANQFDVFITVDKSIAFQNNTPQIPVAVVVFVSNTNSLKQLRPLVPQLLEKLSSLKFGTVTYIGQKFDSPAIGS